MKQSSVRQVTKTVATAQGSVDWMWAYKRASHKSFRGRALTQSIYEDAGLIRKKRPGALPLQISLCRDVASLGCHHGLRAIGEAVSRLTEVAARRLWVFLGYDCKMILATHVPMRSFIQAI
jgi:hypothetical protein